MSSILIVALVVVGLYVYLAVGAVIYGLVERLNGRLPAGINEWELAMVCCPWPMLLGCLVIILPGLCWRGLVWIAEKVSGTTRRRYE